MLGLRKRVLGEGRPGEELMVMGLCMLQLPHLGGSRLSRAKDSEESSVCASRHVEMLRRLYRELSLI